MEKFSQWRDRGTGIAPFLPINDTDYDNFPGWRKVIESILSIISGILRLPLILGASSTYFLLIRRLPVGNFIDRCWIWLLLGLGGAWFWDLGIEGVRKGSFANHRDKLPKPGDLIISNFISPIDVFAYAATFNPLFALPVPGRHDEFALTPLWKVALIALSCNKSWSYLTSPDSELGASLEQVVRSAKTNKRCLVVFGEGSTSNGRGLLHFPNQLPLDELPPRTRIFPVIIKINPSSLTTPIPPKFSSSIGFALINWLWILSTCYKGVHIRIRIANPIKYDSNQSCQQIQSNVIDSLCRIGRIRYLGPQLDQSAKNSFIAAWKKSYID